MQMKVLHLGHSKKWRGGENQVYLLIKGLHSRYADINNYIAFPKGAIAFDRLKNETKGQLSLPSKRAYDIRSIIQIVRYIKQHDISIINAHSGNTHSLAYLVKRFVPHVKVVVHRHVDSPISKKWSSRKKYLSPKINAWVAISDKIHQSLVDYGVNKNNLHVIKSCIDGSRYDQKTKTEDKITLCQSNGMNEKLPLIGFAGVLAEHKQPLLFVKMIQQLIADGFHCHAVMAGAGEDYNKISHYIEEHDLSQQVKLVGFINDVAPFFSALDVFVLPSINEGLGTVLLEAINGGAVVVASDVGGIPEIIKHEKTGFLASSSSPSSFYDAVANLLTNPQQWSTIQQQALAHVHSHFSYDDQIEKTYRVYHDLLKVNKLST